MNPSRPLAERFRTLRTDRIRLEDTEVFSVVELTLPGVTEVEVLIESDRVDVEEGLRLEIDPAPPVGPRSFRLGAFDEPRATFRTGPGALWIWNSWMVDDLECAWTGNHGIVVEQLEAPSGASERMRLWCSDGLGDATFDDLVAVITVGVPEG